MRTKKRSNHRKLAILLSALFVLLMTMPTGALSDSAETTEPAPVETSTPAASSAKPSAEPVAEPAKPTNTQVSEPSPEPVTEQTNTSASELSFEPTEEASSEPTNTPASEPSSEPTEASTEEPTTEPTDEPTSEPIVEASDEPPAEPADESLIPPIEPEEPTDEVIDGPEEVSELIEDEIEDAEAAHEVNPVITLHGHIDGEELTVGTLVTIQAEISGIPEGMDYSLQWQFDRTGDKVFEDVPGGTDTRVTFSATDENVNWAWRLELTVHDAEEAA